MPGTPPLPPTPKSLHQALNATRPLIWDDVSASTDEISSRYGPEATERSLHLLEQAAAVEPIVTDQFLDSLPSGTMPYQLDRRVKSPESLARKIADWTDAGRHLPIDDILRYTAVTENPDELVAAARRTVDELNSHDWHVRTAMHSYTEGSRYKGLHAGLTISGCPRVEVQFHSVASAKIKEMTTPWYEIERSATATLEERAEARQRSVEASKTLKPPQGIDELTKLGGTRVQVNNYSDSRLRPVSEGRATTQGERQQPRTAALDKTDGIAR
ncbi:hypothetical protein [Kribbella speibonae]|uniref:RelA/SpoT domain-containing protein n=1 Tax=Kribbella speibonae TaxID=1572660 RepID=A0ABY1ZVL2_9ACTN|nr:hypothetical protein [Kribbella speibonae]TCC18227.1 hypothetical protein E0H58_36070 [Kribbella speibonae]